MNLKRIAAILLLLTITLGGCGKKEEPKQPPQQTQQSQHKTSNKSNTTGLVEDADEFDSPTIEVTPSMAVAEITRYLSSPLLQISGEGDDADISIQYNKTTDAIVKEVVVSDLECVCTNNTTYFYTPSDDWQKIDGLDLFDIQLDVDSINVTDIDDVTTGTININDSPVEFEYNLDTGLDCSLQLDILDRTVTFDLTVQNTIDSDIDIPTAKHTAELDALEVSFDTYITGEGDAGDDAAIADTIDDGTEYENSDDFTNHIYEEGGVFYVE